MSKTSLSPDSITRLHSSIINNEIRQLEEILSSITVDEAQNLLISHGFIALACSSSLETLQSLLAHTGKLPSRVAGSLIHFLTKTIESETSAESGATCQRNYFMAFTYLLDEYPEAAKYKDPSSGKPPIFLCSNVEVMDLLASHGGNLPGFENQLAALGEMTDYEVPEARL